MTQSVDDCNSRQGNDGGSNGDRFDQHNRQHNLAGMFRIYSVSSNSGPGLTNNETRLCTSPPLIHLYIRTYIYIHIHIHIYVYTCLMAKERETIPLLLETRIG